MIKIKSRFLCVFRRAKLSPWCQLPMFWVRPIHTKASAGRLPTLKIRDLKKVTQVRNGSLLSLPAAALWGFTSNHTPPQLFCFQISDQVTSLASLKHARWSTRSLARSPTQWQLQVQHVNSHCFWDMKWHYSNMKWNTDMGKLVFKEVNFYFCFKDKLTAYVIA